MFAIAFLPLGLYFAVLTFMISRRRPLLLNGRTDAALLSFGLFGLISLGPGKLLIPLYIFNAWGMWSIFYWLLFYFLVTYFICNQCSNYAVIYNCNFEQIKNSIASVAKQFDANCHFDENFFYIPLLGIQLTIRSGNKVDRVERNVADDSKKPKNDVAKSGVAKRNRNGHVFLQLVETTTGEVGWNLFQRELSIVCSNLQTKEYKFPFMLGFIAGFFLTYSFSNFTNELQTMQNIFADYWQ
jgi:hypothetical protein